MSKQLIFIQICLPILICCGLLAATSVLLDLLFGNDSQEDDDNV
ncbi:hypothetical protein UFOVP785_82 [uncultured Caudovirales phage]|uniref:Uncharacterized protein n=1 Tax=uncultured Caudovirales phage TaxID=2100421 RepID=A0A6J5NUJ9_9CAUD|nr:hypothetical protein UFOVP785_82 [uncultured Caudovirales phage]